MKQKNLMHVDSLSDILIENDGAFVLLTLTVMELALSEALLLVSKLDQLQIFLFLSYLFLYK